MFFSLLRARSFFHQPTDTTDLNIRYLYFEVFFAGTLGAIVTYNSLFAVQLGASDALIGILAAAPAFVAAVLSIPSARFLESRVRRLAWLFGSLLFMRLGYLAVVILPFLGLNNPALWLVAWVILLNIPAALFANGWNALLAELIPPLRRALVFSRRTIIYSLCVTVTLLVSGEWLNRIAFPAN